MDNYPTHKKVEIREADSQPPGSTRTSPRPAGPGSTSRSGTASSNDKAIHRGSFESVKDLNTKIRAFINGWNDHCHPFIWTKTAEQILKEGQPSDHFKHGPLGGVWLVASGLTGRGDAVDRLSSQSPGDVDVRLAVTEICESPAARRTPSSLRQPPAQGSTSPEVRTLLSGHCDASGATLQVYVEGKLAWSSTTMSADVIALTQKPVVTDISTEPDVARSAPL